MIKFAVFVILAMTALLAFGAYQDYQNTPERGCSRYASSTEYWLYTCPNGRQFYEQQEN